jgi:hypothetical protein
MGWRLLTVGLICFLLGAGLAIVFGTFAGGTGQANLPSCPHLAARDMVHLPAEVVAAAGAYEAIRETLQRDSIEGVSAQADVIARAFAGTDPKIASVAKRLGAELDVESARRAFRRLHRLMEQHARRLPAA